MGSDDSDVSGRIFEIVGLQKNLGNPKAMVCTPGLIWGKQGVAAYKKRAAGGGGNTQKAEENQGKLR